jgi:zinc transport system substrate-binding protein
MLVGIGIISCQNSSGDKKENKSNDKLKVFAVNYPLYYFAEQIGGDYIDLIYPIPNDIDPAYWEPSEQALGEIQEVDLIIDNGADYASWMEKVSLPTNKIVNTTKAIEDKLIELDITATHSHGADGEHVHYGYAFTTWLDFKIAALQAEAVLNALIKKIPQNEELYRTNFKSLQVDLQSLDNEMAEATKELPKMAFFASHPVYQYLGKAYGLNMISEHWEPGEDPSEEQWTDFLKRLEENPSNLMLWEGIPAESLQSKLIGLKVSSVMFDPCANIPSEGDFISIMKQNIQNLKNYIAEN